jgi:transposase
MSRKDIQYQEQIHGVHSCKDLVHQENKIKFKQGLHRYQETLLPKRLDDYISSDHLARLVVEIAKHLDISSIEAKYSSLGQHAYHPRMMLALLFYGYSIGVRSSRKIAQACEERLDFIYIAQGLTPSHDRIASFRRENFHELNKLFRDIVLIAMNMGMSDIGNIRISIDGSKISANASAKLTKDEHSLRKLLHRIEQETKELLNSANKIDDAEDREDKEYSKKLPLKIRKHKSRMKALRGALETLKEQKKLLTKKLAKSDGSMTSSNQRKIENLKINITDPDAKFMKQRNGVIKPSYNVQLAVDEEEQLIVANDVTTDCNDQHQLIPMVEHVRKNIGKLPHKVKADCGYNSQLQNLTEKYPTIDVYIDDKRRFERKLHIKKKHTKVADENLKKLLSKNGRKEYTRRMHTVEPPFGHLKFNLGYRNFLVRGLQKVKGEFNLMCIGFNLKKIWNFIKKQGGQVARALAKLAKFPVKSH